MGIVLPRAYSYEETFPCKECGEQVELLTRVHVRKHGMTQEEYCIKHPEHAYPVYWGDSSYTGGSYSTTHKFTYIRERADAKREGVIGWNLSCGMCYKFKKSETIKSKGSCKKNGKVKTRVDTQPVCEARKLKFLILFYLSNIFGWEV